MCITCHISSKMVEHLQRYYNLSVFIMAAVGHLELLKFIFLTATVLRHPCCITVPNFVKIGQTVDEISRFCDFQYGGRRHLGFSKIGNFNGRFAVRGQYASPCKMSSKSGKRLPRYGDLTVFFQNGGRPPSWTCWARIRTILDDNLVVSILMQNLVEIDAVVSIVWNFRYFGNAYLRPKIVFFWGGGFHP